VPRPLLAETTAEAAPFMKWAGGKQRLLAQFQPYFPAPGSFAAYLEPFVGGGSVFFHVFGTLKPRRCHLFDGNGDLIETYQAIKDNPEGVIKELTKLRGGHSEEHYYKVRAKIPSTPIARAARIIYLNKTCYNGLYRVNSQGQFNVPMGRYVKPRIFDPENVHAVSHALKNASLERADFRQIQKRAKRNDFVYFDPPYDPLSSTANFTAYTSTNFAREEQAELAEIYRDLDRRGCKLMLSNSDTPFVRELYDGFKVHPILARRNINRSAEKRGPVGEVLVVNYKP
jgi:DNA adenine methylase